MVVASARHRHALAAAAVVAVTTLSATGIAAAASPHRASDHGSATATSMRLVTYRGYAFEVPRTWAVINLVAHPTTCVRFDRHALYLGRPGAAQSCPSGLIGSTEAVLAEPA